MSHADLKSAAQDFADSRAALAARIKGLKGSARRLVKSPYVIGGAAAAVAVAGLLAARQRPTGPPASGRGWQTALRWFQRLLPLLGAAGAAKAAVPAAPPPLLPAVPVQVATTRAAEVAGTPPMGEIARSWFAKQWTLVKAAVKGWSDDYAPSMGAALSYYTLFSLAPLLIIVIGVAGMVFGQQAAQGEILGQLRAIMGEEGAVAVEGMLKASRDTGKGVLATIVGAGVLLLGSTAVFSELQSALDRIWETPAPPNQSGIWHMVRTRLLSFGLVLGLGFLLIVSLVVSAGLSALGKWWGGWFEGWDVLLQAVNIVVSLGLFTVLFAMIYKLMPRAKISWHDVWTGAAVTALLFTIGKVLIGLYLGRSTLASGFGAAGSLVVMIAWVYYSAQIFLLGAEYTWAYAKAHGSHAGQPATAKSAAIPSRPR